MSVWATGLSVSAKIVNLGLDYRTQSLADPPGWTKTDLSMALRLGYSKASAKPQTLM